MGESEERTVVLKKSETLLLEMTTLIPGVVFQFYARPNGEMGFYYISDGSERILGLKPDLEGYFGRFMSLVIPEHKQGFIKSIEKSVNESSEWKYEGMLQKPSGEKIWFSCNSILSPREDEIVFNGIVTDITERKRIETLRALTNKLLQQLNESGDFVGLIRKVLKSIQEYTGFEVAAFRLQEGDDYPYLVQYGFSDEFVKSENYLCERNKSGDIVRDNKGSPVLDCMCGNIIRGRTDPKQSFFTKGGSFWNNCTTELLAKTSEKERQSSTKNRCNGEGYESVALIPLRAGTEIIGLLQFNDKRKNCFSIELIQLFESIAISIGSAFSRKRVEDELRESEKKYRELTENINDAIFTLNLENIITYISPPILLLTGYTPEELVGRPFSKLIHPNDLPELERSFRDTIENHLKPREFRYRTKDGKMRWARISNRPILEGSISIGIRGMFSDITGRKRLEGEVIKLEKIESLGILAGGIAHDFNNILTGIIGNISIVRHQVGTSGESIEILKQAEKAAFQAKNLTQQLLTFARGGTPIKKMTVLSDLLKETTLFATRGSKTSCKFNISPNLKLVNIDPGQISQIVSNIVINAVQAMPEGGDISITADNVNLSEDSNVNLKAGPYIRIIITDTGNGIPADNLVKIFNPYFTTKETGNGLGLATAYSIIKNHDGHISVESEIGKGSSFTIHLPAFVGKDDAAVLSHSKEIKKGHGRILIMDDEEMICMVLIKILTRLGYTAQGVSDSDKAITLYREKMNTPEAFDAVILDLTLPGGKGGKEVMVLLKEIDPEIKAVVSSGYSTGSIVSNYKDYGFSAVLPKPFNVEEVGEVLYRLLYTA